VIPGGFLSADADSNLPGTCQVVSMPVRPRLPWRRCSGRRLAGDSLAAILNGGDSSGRLPWW